MSYCEYINTITGWALDLNKTYHDEKYGFPIEDDNELFGRLLLEINQAGLSWSTILRKEAAFRIAYDKFDIEIDCQLYWKQKKPGFYPIPVLSGTG